MTKVVLEKVLEVLYENYENENMEKIKNETNFLEIGLNSATFIKCIVLLEDYFNVEIPDEKLLMVEMNTPERVAEVICLLL